MQHLSSGDIARYNAIGLGGQQATNSADGVLCLGGQPTADCPQGAEYDACPDTWILNHLADGSSDPLTSSGTVATSITVVACSQDLENQVPKSVTLQFRVTNEFEQTLSASTTVTCWGDIPLAGISPIFNRESLGGDFAQTRISTAGGQSGGFMVVAQTARAASAPGAAVTSSMVNLHVEGTQSTGDVIRIPIRGARRGVVR